MLFANKIVYILVSGYPAKFPSGYLPNILIIRSLYTICVIPCFSLTPTAIDYREPKVSAMQQPS